jgi:hypothetical protein
MNIAKMRRSRETKAAKASTVQFGSSLLSQLLSLLFLLVLLNVALIPLPAVVHAFSASVSITASPLRILRQTEQPPNQRCTDSSLSFQSSLCFSRLSSSAVPSDVSSSYSTTTLDDLKLELVNACQSINKKSNNNKPSLSGNNIIQDLVTQLEDKAEQMGIGQASALTGMMAGEW